MFIFLWRDICEIIFFITLFNIIVMWLHKDQSKKLCAYFFYYLAFSGICYLLQLQTITTFLFWYSPIIALLFVILHQETLQKQFITPKNKYIPYHVAPNDWPNILVSICLQNMNQVKATICIIERECILDSLLEIPFALQLTIDASFLSMVCSSPSYDETKMILVTQHGIVKAINSAWKHTDSANHTLKPITSATELYDFEDMQKITEKTDALILISDPMTRLFTIMIHEIIFNKITALHAVQLIKKHIVPAQKTSYHGDIYANKTVFSSSQQHT